MIKPQSEASTQLNRKDIPRQHKTEIQQEWAGIPGRGEKWWLLINHDGLPCMASFSHFQRKEENLEAP